MSFHVNRRTVRLHRAYSSLTPLFNSCVQKSVPGGRCCHVRSCLAQVSLCLNLEWMRYIAIFIATHPRGRLTETVFDVCMSV